MNSPVYLPEVKTIEIREGQKGISYRRLFEPYLKGAKKISLIDPYIRLDYQIHNLMAFIEVIDDSDEEIEFKLTTAAGSEMEEVELSEKLDQIQQSAFGKKVNFHYTFDSVKHDRQIETDTGWRISLGRGLDIFHRNQERYALGFIDQTQRKCKETSVIFSRI